MDDFWKDLTIVTTLFFLLPFEFDSKVNNTKIKKGENGYSNEKIKRYGKLPPGFELETFSMQSKCADHYSTDSMCQELCFTKDILFILSILAEKLK